MKYLFITVGLIVLVGVTFAVTKRYFPTVVPETEIRYVDRDILRRDTVTVVRPEIRTVFRTVRDTVRISVNVPRDLTFAGVITPSPIRFSRGDVILTYFADSSFVQDRFAIPRPTWGYSVASFVGVDVLDRSPTFGFEGRIRYKRVAIFGRAFALSENYLTAGLIFRLYGKD